MLALPVVVLVVRSSWTSRCVWKTCSSELFNFPSDKTKDFTEVKEDFTAVNFFLGLIIGKTWAVVWGFSSDEKVRRCWKGTFLLAWWVFLKPKPIWGFCQVYLLLRVTKLLWKVVNHAMNQKSMMEFLCSCKIPVFVSFEVYLSKRMQIMLKTLWLQRWNMAKERKWTKGSINLANSEFTPSSKCHNIHDVLCQDNSVFFHPQICWWSPPKKSLLIRKRRVIAS